MQISVAGEVALMALGCIVAGLMAELLVERMVERMVALAGPAEPGRCWKAHSSYQSASFVKPLAM